MTRAGYASVDDYIAAQPAAARPVLERVRATLRKALPRATEGISYQIPILKLEGAMVLYFAGFQRHYSVYPATPGVIEALGAELAGALHSKATIRFSYEDPVPARLIARIARVRAAEVAERRAAKGKAPSSGKGTSGGPRPRARGTLAKRRATRRAAGSRRPSARRGQ